MDCAQVLRDWDIFSSCYKHIDDPRADAQRIGERIVHRCLADPISHPPGNKTSTEILNGTDLFSYWSFENRFLQTFTSIRCDEVPPEEVTNELLANALHPTHIEEK
jgi:hypothetical protein